MILLMISLHLLEIIKMKKAKNKTFTIKFSAEEINTLSLIQKESGHKTMTKNVRHAIHRYLGLLKQVREQEAFYQKMRLDINSMIKTKTFISEMNIDEIKERYL